MNHEHLYNLFQDVSQGRLNPEAAMRQIESMSYTDLGFAKVDHHRQQRMGFPEVVYAAGKTVEQLFEICSAHLEVHDRLLITRLSAEKQEQLLQKGIQGRYNSLGRTLVFDQAPVDPIGDILVCCAGTSDLPVAEEARETAAIMGNRVEVIADVGVAGIHRLLDRTERIQQARVIIVIAGMEGALASVVGGLAAVPVIAVPTSVGYGASFQGLAALLTMLNSCAPGVAVVNIDNGFGAAFTASLINKSSSS